MGAAVRSSYALAKLQRAVASKPGLEVTHPDFVDGRIWVAGTDDRGGMAKQLADLCQRLKRGGMAGDNDPVGADLVAGTVQHAPGIFQLLAQPQPQLILRMIGRGR